MSQHTPGPWEVRQLEGNLFVWAGSIWITRVYSNRGLPEQQPEYEANARLIAEAPAMYEALKEAYLRHVWEGTRLFESMKAILARIDKEENSDEESQP